MTTSPKPAPKRIPRLVLLLAVAAVVIVIDQWVKQWVLDTLPLHIPVDVFPWLKPIASFTYIRNTGVAFGMLQEWGQVFRFFSPLVVIAVIIFQRTIPYEMFWVHFALGLVSGGALGNAADRFTRGFVVDFIDVNFWPFRDFPLFNVADSAITVGTAILLLDTFLTPEEAPGTDSAVAEASPMPDQPEQDQAPVNEADDDQADA